MQCSWISKQQGSKNRNLMFSVFGPSNPLLVPFQVIELGRHYIFSWLPSPLDSFFWHNVGEAPLLT